MQFYFFFFSTSTVILLLLLIGLYVGFDAYGKNCQTNAVSVERASQFDHVQLDCHNYPARGKYAAHENETHAIRLCHGTRGTQILSSLRATQIGE